MKKAFAACLVLMLICVRPAFAQDAYCIESKQKRPRDIKDLCECKARTANGFNVVGPLINMNSSDDPAPIRPRGGEVDWGLALSGGGIRSASFGIGVMKALYEKGLMNDIDVVSSVSGGGYGAYWLLTSHEQNNPKGFGSVMFADEVFLRNVCELEEASDFIKLGSFLKRIFWPRRKTIEYYQERITRTFSNPRDQKPQDSKEQTIDPRLITFLNHSIASGEVPYFIFNASVNSRLSGYAGLVETSPDYIGNPVLGFSKWSSAYPAWRMVQAVAVSGAALKGKLELPIGNYATQIWPEHELKLWDGGGFENLGALPLIRRGIKNIIIVDAEEDSKYNFEAYWKLKKLLCPMGINFTVPDIENFWQERQEAKQNNRDADRLKFYDKDVSLGTAVSTGATIDGKPISSNIYYVKMSRSSLGNYDQEAFEKGRRLVADRDEKIRCKKRECNCAAAPTLESASDYYVFFVNNYDSHRNKKKLKTWTFPQVPSIDQNLEPATMEALIGLGYLEGLKVKPQ